AVLLPGEPHPAALPAPRARVRERAAHAGHLLEPDRARLPERRLPDPSLVDARQRYAGSAALARPAPAPHPASLRDGLPPPGPFHHHAAGLRPLPLFRGGEVPLARGTRIRLPQDSMGGERDAAGQRQAVRLDGSRRGIGLRRRRRGYELAGERLELLDLLLDLRPQ